MTDGGAFDRLRSLRGRQRAGAAALAVLFVGLVAGAPAAPGAPGRVGQATPAEVGPDGNDAERDAEDATGVLRAEIRTLRAEVDTLRTRVARLTARISIMRPALESYRLPDAVTFAGTPVPLDRWDVAERLEREFYLALGDPAQVILWLKRSARYFPYIETKLRAAGLSDDLKYVAVVESALRPRANSWANASGIWQFVPETARRYGLRVTASYDERRDPARATTAALAYLGDLHRQLRDWPLALAAYNAGEQRVEAALERQGVGEYYQLALPAETERYVFRVLVAKLLLEDPARYDFAVPPEERYPPRAADLMDLRVVGALDVQELARAAGSFYREIGILNPAIMSAVLPPGRYTVRIPQGHRAGFMANLPALTRAMAAHAAPRVQYRVKSRDTLADIARRFGVSVGALRKWNRAARGRYIRPGDRLIIERPRRP